MSRKDYKDFAAMLAKLRELGYDTKTLDRITEELVDIFINDNANFDSRRFAIAAMYTK